VCEIGGHGTGGIALSEQSIQYSRGELVGKKRERVNLSVTNAKETLGWREKKDEDKKIDKEKQGKRGKDY